MKKLNLIASAIVALGALSMVSCKNQDQKFPDFDYQTIYFANQSPVQTITLGEDGEFDVTDDNLHRFTIYATVGGINTNKKDRWVNYEIKPELLKQVYFADGTPVEALPTDYYEITSDKQRINIAKGEIMGGINIQLKDAFFNDPKSVGVNYVIPVLLTQGSDSILQGELKDGGHGNCVDPSDWNVQPKNFTLYGIKFKNPYDGAWLSRGKGKINGEDFIHEASSGYWEDEDTIHLVSKSLKSVVRNFSHAVPYVDASGVQSETVISCNVILNVADDGTVTCTTDTEGARVNGGGKYTYHGAGQAWGALQRDLFDVNYDYEISYKANEVTGEIKTFHVVMTEKLVSRDRMNKFETFSYTVTPSNQ